MDRIQRANDLGYYALDDDHVYDIDTLKISNLHVDWLPLLTYGIVDIAGREPYVPELKHLDEDLGLCIVSAPMYISLSHVTKKNKIRRGLWHSLREQFMPISDMSNRFLSCGPRKCHLEHIPDECVARSHIHHVNTYVYGMESTATHMLFLDDTNSEAAMDGNGCRLLHQSVYCSYISYIFLYCCKIPITSYIFAHFLYFPVFFVIVRAVLVRIGDLVTLVIDMIVLVIAVG